MEFPSDFSQLGMSGFKGSIQIRIRGCFRISESWYSPWETRIRNNPIVEFRSQTTTSPIFVGKFTNSYSLQCAKVCCTRRDSEDYRTLCLNIENCRWSMESWDHQIFWIFRFCLPVTVQHLYQTHNHFCIRFFKWSSNLKSTVSCKRVGVSFSKKCDVGLSLAERWTK